MKSVNDVHITPGMLLVLPTMEANPGVVVHGRADKEGGEGVIVRCQSRTEMPPTYTNPVTGEVAQMVSREFIPRVGMTIIYKRVSSQHVPLLDENGDHQEYRMVHQDDVGIWFDPEASDPY